MLGFIALYWSFCIPNQRIVAHVSNSTETFISEGAYPTIGEFGVTTLDNFTDARMLATAGYDGTESASHKALMGYSLRAEGTNPVDSLIQLYGNNTDTSVAQLNYSRYWQGYLVPLRVGLLFFDYAELRVINTVCQSLLVIGLTALIIYRKKYLLLPPLGLLMLTLCLPAINVSIQYSTVFYPTILGLLILLMKKGNHFNFKFLIWLFFIEGIVVNYFDMLTYPLVNFGVLYSASLYLDQANEDNKDTKYISNSVKNFFILLFFWGFGYAGMWIGKWLLAAAIIGDRGIITDAITQAAVRSSINAQMNSQAVASISYINVVVANISVLCGEPFGLLICTATIISAVTVFILHGLRYQSIRLNLLCATMPFVWYAVMGNHSYVHAFFTYRELAISVFAITLSALMVLKQQKYLKSQLPA